MREKQQVDLSRKRFSYRAAKPLPAESDFLGLRLLAPSKTVVADICSARIPVF
ncbi:hypothetical protein GCM10008931_18050 [Oceanobacillus oncorhynchi subsp. oncorhynchi]